MKKKYRDITVNGAKYAWQTTHSTLTIWFNKKVIHTVDVSQMITAITPKHVAEIIKTFV